MEQKIGVKENHRPVYCRGCRGKKTFEHFPAKDTKTETGKVILEAHKCGICGHIAWVTARW